MARSDLAGSRSPAAGQALRVFVAVPLTEALRAALGQVRGRFAGEPAVRWVAPENLHITLRFLGAVPEARLDDVAAAVEEASRQVGPFLLELGSCGRFPPRGAARVLWVGITAGGSELSTLAELLEDALARRGFPREARAFRAHVTVARIRDGWSFPEADAWLAEWRDERFGQMQVEAAHVMESRLRPEGPIYRSLRACPLGRAGR
ncbi:MAG TPA: RNA 2',3'-cyclic phosphodiesterase [Limnochorda sp.]